MISKIIGIAIVGVVLSLGSASLAKNQVENFNSQFNTYGYGRLQQSKVERGLKPDIQNSYYRRYGTIRYDLYDSRAVYNAFLYLGILLTVVFMQYKINSPKVFRYMAYSLFFSVAIGFFLGFYNAYEDYRYFFYDLTVYQIFNDDYLKNCTYVGFGIAALIFGVNLTNKKPVT